MKIGISGAGIGGLAASIAMLRDGHEVTVYEQASKFARVGADINLTPNAVMALDGLGIGDKLRETAARPTHRISRDWDTGHETSRIEMQGQSEGGPDAKYGAPQLTMHRADLMTALEESLPREVVKFSKRLKEVADSGAANGGITVRFEDGTTDTVDVLIGADGIHSAVRTAMLGQEKPVFTGVVAYRAVVPADKLKGVSNLNAFTKWWGPNPSTQIVTFPLNLGNDIFIFATTPQDTWRDESWTQPGDIVELRSHYTGFHPEARALLDACDSVLKSALYVRDPLPSWSKNNMALLGDAAHPMMPFMAQGAGMAIEDAIVMARYLKGATNETAAAQLVKYQDFRLDRASRIQIGSRGNEWMKVGGNADWVYAYNAWTVPLV